MPQPCNVVIFGASGDLTFRKLIPALYNIAADGDLPAALSIVGFDGIPLSSMTTPRLTTVKQPIQKIAVAAVAALLDKERTSDADSPVLFACELSVGETTSPPQPDYDTGIVARPPYANERDF